MTTVVLPAAKDVKDMLSGLVGKPVAVNPDRALRRVAQQRGWPVLTFGALSAGLAAALSASDM